MSKHLYSLICFCSILLANAFAYAESVPSSEGMRLWLKADTGIEYGANNGVAKWQDQSGKNNHGTQGSAGWQPSVVFDDEVGYSMVSFDATKKQHLNLGNMMNGATEGEIFAVLRAKENKPSAIYGLWLMGTYETFYPGGLNGIYEGFGSKVQHATGQSVDISDWHIYNVSSKAGSFSSRFDGQLSYHSSSNTVAWYSGMRIGGNAYYFSGDIAEVIVYDKVLSDGERDAVGRYLAKKYAVASVQVPEIPVDVSGVTLGSDQVSLVWKGNVDVNGVRYIVERRQGDGDWEVIGRPNGRSYVDVGLESGATYHYRIKATNYGGDSEYSEVYSITVPSTGTSMPMSSMRTWLRADAQNVGLLSCWQDQSGKNNHGTQGSAGWQPSVVFDDEVGYSMVSFDASKKQHLSLGNMMNGATEGEIFAVLRAKENKPSGIQGLWLMSGKETHYPYGVHGIYEGFGSTTQHTTGQSVDISDWHIYNVSSKAGSFSSRFDGQLSYYSSSNTVAWYSGMRIGGNAYHFSGDIAEVIVYDKVLSDGERDAVGRYLAKKYAVASVQVPEIPVDVSGVTLGSDQVSLVWKGNVDVNGVRYIVERRQGDGDWEEIGRGNGRSYVDVGLESGVTYHYRIKATNYGGDSEYSEVYSITVPSTGTSMPMSSMRTWLRADAQNVGLLSCWQDQSGKGNHGMQGSAGWQPSVIFDDEVGYSLVRFDATKKQHLNLGNMMNGATEGEIFAVLRAKENKPSAIYGLWLMGTYETFYPGGLNGIYEGFGSKVQHATGQSVDISDWHIYNVSSKAGSFSSRFDGQLSYYSSSNTVAWYSGMRIGGNAYHFSGDIAEVIVYDKVLSDGERDAVGRYLAKKYAVASVQVPEIPVDVSGVTLGSDQVSLVWKGNVDVNGVRYIVERRQGDGDWEEIGRGNGRSYVDVGLESGVTYHYRIKATNYGGDSEYSEVYSITVPSTGTSMPMSSMRTWLRADAQNGGNLNCWIDQSGKGNNAVQGSVSTQPEVILNSINSLPAVKFDSTKNQYLSLRNVLQNATEGEIFAVLRVKDSKPSLSKELWRFGTGNSSYTYYPGSDGGITENFARNGSVGFGIPAVDISDWHIYNVSSKAGSFSSRFNGQLYYETTSNQFYATTSASIGLGYASYFDGDITEIIVYDKVLSGAERDTVGRYLTAKYKLQSAPEIPTHLSAVTLGIDQISLVWKGNTDAKGIYYIIERRQGDGDWEEVERANGRSYVDVGLESGATYHYRIKATNYGGDSEYSEVYSITIPTSGTSSMPMTSMRAWLRADAAQGTGILGFWMDQSGNNNHAFQNRANQQPEVIPNVINGLPAVKFDSTKNQYLSLNNVLQNATEGEIFAVLRTKDRKPSRDKELWRFGTGSYTYAYYPKTDGSITDNFARNGMVTVGVPALDISDWHIYNVSSKSGYWASRFNGQLQYETTSNQFYATTSASIGLGYTSYFDGDIAEIIVYDKVLSETERQAVEKYLQTKYMSGEAEMIPPKNLTARLATNTNVQISWNAGSEDASTLYLIERKQGEGDFSEIGRTYFASRSYLDTTSLAGETYSYRIKTRSFNGESVYSNIITISVPSGATDQSLPQSGMCVWLQQESGIVLDEKGFVHFWYDQSGKGNHARQDVAGNRPTLAENEYGVKVISFDAVKSQYLTMRKPIGTENPGEAFIMVKSSVKTGKSQVLWNFGADRGYYPNANGTISEGFGVTSVKNVGTPIVDIDGWHLYNVSSDLGSWIARFDGNIQYSSGNDRVSFAHSYPTIGSFYGGSSPFSGQVAEVIIYNRVLDDSEREAVLSYFNRRYEHVIQNPVFTPEAGIYENSVEVKLSVPGVDADIYYTLDGSEPEVGVSPKYTVPIRIERSTQIKAVAWNGTEASAVNSGLFSIGIPKPAVQIGYGLLAAYSLADDFHSKTTHLIKDAQLYKKTYNDFAWFKGQDAYVAWTGTVLPQFTERYTFYFEVVGGVRVYLDNELVIDDYETITSRELTYSCDLVGGREIPIRIEFFKPKNSGKMVLSWSSDFTAKELIHYANLHSGVPLDSFANTPAASPESGSINELKGISLTTTAGNIVRYTLDGSDPDEKSTLYTEPIYLMQDTQIRARAWRNNCNPSGVMVENYTVVLDKPSISELTFAGVSIPAQIDKTEYFGVKAASTLGIAKVEFFVDDKLIATTYSGSGNNIYKGLFKLDDFADGVHTLRVQATDKYGRFESITQAFTVAYPVPAAPKITEPRNGSVFAYSEITVKGTAIANSVVSLFRKNKDGVESLVGTINADASGKFSFTANLEQESNIFSAYTRFRNPLPSPRSEAVTVTYDNEAPLPPRALRAAMQANGRVKLLWEMPASGKWNGYSVYRSDAPFTSETRNTATLLADSLGSSSTVYYDTAPSDGEYYYAVASYRSVGDVKVLSELSNVVKVSSDRTAPKATSITYSSIDAPIVGKEIGFGRIEVTLDVSEELSAAPILSLFIAGVETPVAVDLKPSGSLSYKGEVAFAKNLLGALTPSFSAYDLAGNKGTVIDQYPDCIVDTVGPCIVGLTELSYDKEGYHSLEPRTVIKNEPAGLTLYWLLELSKELLAGEQVRIVGKVSGDGIPRPDVEASVADGSMSGLDLPEGEENYFRLIALTLPADMGMEKTEHLQLVFSGKDALNNIGTLITVPHDFQIYQGELPPLDTPSDFSGKALPNGEVELSWSVVEEAAAYALEVAAISNRDDIPVFGTLTVLEDPEATSYRYHPAIDGLYAYRLATVRRAGEDEALSAWSPVVIVDSDSEPPPSATDFSVNIVSGGVSADWILPESTEDIHHFAIYRSAMEINSIDGLTPLIPQIAASANWAVDSKPDGKQPWYALVAVDAAGNTSAPLSAFLADGVFAVRTLSVLKHQGSTPIVTWTPTPNAVIDEFHFYIDGINAESIQKNHYSYSDTGYKGGERTYTVAVVANNISRPRSVAVPDIKVVVPDGVTLHRGLIQNFDVDVSNDSSGEQKELELTLTIDGKAHKYPSALNFEAGESKRLSFVVGGYDRLPASGEAKASWTMVQKPEEGISMTYTDGLPIPMTQGSFTTDIVAKDIVRGSNGKVQFTFTNTSDVPVDIETASGFGKGNSPSCRVYLYNEEGRVISNAYVKVFEGMDIVQLNKLGIAVARIAPGKSWTSPWIDIAVPASAGSFVTATAVFDTVYYDRGGANPVSVKGPSASIRVPTRESDYVAILSVTPDVVNRDEPVTIAGRVYWRVQGPDAPAAATPITLVFELNGYRISKKLTTEADGSFRHIYQEDGSGRGGIYKVWVLPPGIDVPVDDPVIFEVRALSVKPGQANMTIPRNYTQVIPYILSSAIGTQLTNVRFEPVSVPSDVEVVFPTAMTLTSNQKNINFPVSITPKSKQEGIPNEGTLVFALLSDGINAGDGAIEWQQVHVNYIFTDGTARLQAIPSSVSMGVQTAESVEMKTDASYDSVEVKLKNTGFQPLDSVTIELIDGVDTVPNWVNLQGSNVGDIEIGDTVSFVILARPPLMSISQDRFYLFTVRINSPTLKSPLLIPVELALSPHGTGSVKYHIVDPYYQYVFEDRSNPSFDGLPEAKVILRKEASDGSITQTYSGTSDSRGMASFSVPSGRYRVSITANKHDSYSGMLTVKPGVEHFEKVALAYDAVTVDWKVVPVTIDDKYDIVIDTKFETHVPVPVLVVEPASVTIPETLAAGQYFYAEYKVTNKGLLRADNFEIELPPSDGFHQVEMAPLLKNYVDPGETINIPVRVKILKNGTGSITSDDAKENEQVRPLLRSSGTDDSEGGQLPCGYMWLPYKKIYTYKCPDGSTYHKYDYFYMVRYFGPCPKDEKEGGGTSEDRDWGSIIIDPNPGSSSFPPSGTPGSGTINIVVPGTGTGDNTNNIPNRRPATEMDEDGCYPISVSPPLFNPDLCDPMHDYLKGFLYPTGSAVLLTNRDYVDRVEDLTLSIPGGKFSLVREYENRRWRVRLNSKIDVLKSAVSGAFLQVDDAPYYLSDQQTPRTPSVLFDENGFTPIRGSLNDAAVGIYTYNSYKLRKFSDGTLIWSDGLGEERYFDAAGKHLKTMRGGRLFVSFEYDGSGNLSLVKDRMGRVILTILSGDNANEVRYKDLGNREVLYSWNSMGRLLSVVNASGLKTTYEYGRYGELKKRTDVNGTVETIEYVLFELENAPKSGDVPFEEPVNLNYKPARVKAIKDHLGRAETFNYQYNAADDTYYAKVNTRAGVLKEYWFDSMGRMTEYRIDGRSASRYAAGENTVNVYNNGITFKHELDSMGRVVRTNYADGTFENYEYDAHWNKYVRVVDRSGVETRMDYDINSGDLLWTTEAFGTEEARTTHYQYNADGTLSKLTDPAGKSVEFIYDAYGRLIESFETADPTRRSILTYDMLGRVVSTRNPDGAESHLAYDASDNIILEKDAHGIATRASYTGTRLLEIERGCLVNEFGDVVERGRIERYRYDNEGRLLQVIRVSGENKESVAVTNIYDADGNLLSEKGPIGGAVAYSYDGEGRLYAVTNPTPNGGSVEEHINYDVKSGFDLGKDYILSGDSSRTVIPASLRNAYDINGRIATQILAPGSAVERILRYSYDNSGRLLSLKQISENEETIVSEFVYDRFGNVLKVKGERETPKEFTYDIYGRIKSETDANNDITSYTYTLDGNIESIRRNGKLVKFLEYSKGGLLLCERDGLNNKRYYHHDLLGRLTEVSVAVSANDDLSGNWWEDASKVLVATRYNRFGDVVKETRYTGLIGVNMQYDYDDFGRRTKTVLPTGMEIRYEYDAADNLVRVIYPDANGSNWTTEEVYSRNAYVPALLDSVKNRSGAYLNNKYDALGRIIEESNSLGSHVNYYYDSFGRSAKEERYNSNNILEYSTENSYDSFDYLRNVTSVDHLSEGARRTQEYVYDKRGLLKEQRGSGLHPVIYGYDAVGNMTSMQDGNGKITRWSYNAFGLQTSKTYADGKIWTYAYDDAGRLAERKDGKGQITRYGYNPAGQLIEAIYPSDSIITFEYDQQGRRIKMDDATGETVWKYNDFGFLASETQALTQRKIVYDYNGYGARSRMTVDNADGFENAPWATNYGYDKYGRLASIQDMRIGVNPFRYTWDDNGDFVKSISMPDTVNISRNYDSFGRLTQSELRRNASAVKRFSYTYNGFGERTSVRTLNNANRDAYDYRYNERGELVVANNVAATAGNRAYNYDDIGNRNWASEGNPTVASIPEDMDPLSTIKKEYTVNEVNQYSQIISNSSTSVPAFDDNGNMTSDGNVTYVYDDENRLIAMAKNQDGKLHKHEFVYDGLGRRVERKEYVDMIISRTVRFVYDGRLVIEELDSSGALVQSYTRGLDLGDSLDAVGGIGGLLAMTDASGTTGYYYSDAQGNVTDIIQPNGTVLAHYEYDPFGKTSYSTGGWIEKNPYRFSSKEYNSRFGLYDYGYRYYSPDLGRWINRDPLEEDGGLNLYGFVNNNGINEIDPHGLAWYNPYDWARGMGNYIGGLVGMECWDQLISLGLDLIPIIGQIKAGIEFVTGRDLLTGQPVPRWASGMGFLLPYAGKAIGIGGKILGKLGGLGGKAAIGLGKIGGGALRGLGEVLSPVGKGLAKSGDILGGIPKTLVGVARGTGNAFGGLGKLIPQFAPSGDGMMRAGGLFSGKGGFLRVPKSMGGGSKKVVENSGNQNVLKESSRRRALDAAQKHAQVPRESKGGKTIPFDDLNKPGKNTNKIKSEGATNRGRMDENSKAKFEDHPDGHPHLPGPEHHDFPHVHATDKDGIEIIITYPS